MGGESFAKSLSLQFTKCASSCDVSQMDGFPPVLVQMGLVRMPCKWEHFVLGGEGVDRVVVNEIAHLHSG